MTPVDQETVHKGTGDCQRATTASLLDIDLDQVPNFIKFSKDTWFGVYNSFMWAMGYEYEGDNDDVEGHPLLQEESIGGYFEAAVPSRTLPGCTHSVVIDMDGVVIHDPNPNKKWQGVNVLETGDLLGWYMFSKREQ